MDELQSTFHKIEGDIAELKAQSTAHQIAIADLKEQAAANTVAVARLEKSSSSQAPSKEDSDLAKQSHHRSLSSDPEGTS